MKIRFWIIPLSFLLMTSCTHQEPTPTSQAQAAKAPAKFRKPADDDQFDCRCKDRKAVCGPYERLILRDMNPQGLEVTAGDVEFEVGERIEYRLSDDQTGAPEQMALFHPSRDEMNSFIGIAPLFAADANVLKKQGGFVQMILRDQDKRTIRFKCRKY